MTKIKILNKAFNPKKKKKLLNKGKKKEYLKKKILYIPFPLLLSPKQIVTKLANLFLYRFSNYFFYLLLLIN